MADKGIVSKLSTNFFSGPRASEQDIDGDDVKWAPSFMKNMKDWFGPIFLGSKIMFWVNRVTWNIL